MITILKINNFKVTKSTTTEFNCHNFSPTNLDVHAILNLLDLELKRGSGGGGGYPPQKQNNFFKNQIKCRLFLYFFLLFGRAP